MTLSIRNCPCKVKKMQQFQQTHYAMLNVYFERIQRAMSQLQPDTTSEGSGIFLKGGRL